MARQTANGSRAGLFPLLIAILLLSPGCGSPEPGGPGRTAGSRVGADSSGILPPPHIEFDKLFHDFGEIDQHESSTARFTFRNSGQSLLFIRNIRPS